MCKLFCLGYIKSYCYTFIKLIDICSTKLKDSSKIIDEINKNKNGNYFTKDLLGYIKIIIIALIFTIVGLIIGKKIFALRKKRANELVDDYYQYDSEKKDIKNDNLTSANIEMNSKLGLK